MIRLVQFFSINIIFLSPLNKLITQIDKILYILI